MAELREILESIGLEDVRTYIQSGNVVFRTHTRSTSKLTARIREAVAKDRDFEPEVMLLSLDEVERAMEANPFPEAEDEPKALHLFFLSSNPDDPDLEGLESKRAPGERFAIESNVFYLHAPDGIGRSKLAASAERLLGVPATARNWRTVTKIIEMAGES